MVWDDPDNPLDNTENVYLKQMMVRQIRSVMVPEGYYQVEACSQINFTGDCITMWLEVGVSDPDAERNGCLEIADWDPDGKLANKVLSIRFSKLS